METSSEVYEGILRPQNAEPAVGHHDLEVLGEPSAARRIEVRSQVDATVSQPSGRVTVANVLRLLERQTFRCALTSRRLTCDTASLDHIVPVRCGGEHWIENTQVLHKDVNRAKTTMTNEEFIRLCREVVEHCDNTNVAGATP